MIQLFLSIIIFNNPSHQIMNKSKTILNLFVNPDLFIYLQPYENKNDLKSLVVALDLKQIQ